jgi:hypothetical protein
MQALKAIEHLGAAAEDVSAVGRWEVRATRKPSSS